MEDKPTLPARARRVFEVLLAAGYAFSNHRAIRLGAGLAYYSLFALVPVLWAAVSLAAVFFGGAAVAELERAITDLVGEEIAEFIVYAIDAISPQEDQTFVALVSVGVLLFTASLLFVAWKEVVDLIWGIPRERGVRAYISRRLFGVAALFGGGVLLTAVLVGQAAVSFADRIVENDLLEGVIRISASLLPSLLGAVSLAVLFRYTPDAKVDWRDVWFPAALTMLVLDLFAWGYGVYLQLFGFRSSAGIAGTLVLGLVFIYLSAQILLYGMEVVREGHLRRQADGRDIWA